MSCSFLFIFFQIKIGNLCINNSSSEKLFGINFDCKLKFTNHIEEIFKKASRKLNAIVRLAPYMDISKRRTLMNAFLKSQFNYCPLIKIVLSLFTNKISNSLQLKCSRYQKVYVLKL